MTTTEATATPELQDTRTEEQIDEDVHWIYRELTEIVGQMPPTTRWSLVLAEDRWSLAEEIAKFVEVGDCGYHDARRRWWTERHSQGRHWHDLLKTKMLSDGTSVTSEAPINAYYILSYHPRVKNRIRWNDYAKRIEITGDSPLAGRPDIDTIVTAAQNWICEEEEVTIAREHIGQMLTLVAHEHAYNPLHDYLFSLKWDGTPRVDHLFSRYFGAADTPHNRRISRRWSLGAVGRAMPNECWCTDDGRDVGMKFDNVLILESVQGEKKSSAFEVLGGRFYCSSSITVADRDSKMLASASWFVDSPELASFKRAETEAVKAFTSTRTDSYRAPYGRGIIHVARHCVPTGSTNDEHYFTDQTGNRRYWPVKCGTIDLAALMRDRDQIWAEAVHTFLQEMDCAACRASTDTVQGQRPRCKDHRWWLDKEEEADAAVVADERKKEVPLTSIILAWWQLKVPSMRPLQITTATIATEALNLTADKLASRSVETAIGIAMRELGFTKRRPEIGGRRVWVYEPSAALLGLRQQQGTAESLFNGTGTSPGAGGSPAAGPPAVPATTH